MVIVDNGISETLGHDILRGLRNAKGEELGETLVPRLNSFECLALQPRIVKKYMLLNTATTDNALDQFGSLTEKLFDEEGIALIAEVLSKAFKEPIDSIAEKFDADSLLKVFAFIVKRDFKFDKLIKGFTDRFSEMFGGDEENPPKTAS